MLTDDQIEEIRTRDCCWHDPPYGDDFKPQAFARAIEAAVRAEYKPMRDFVAEIMEVWPDGGIDGDVLQEIAVSHGLLQLKSPNPTEPCGENCGCRDYVTPEEFAQGIECYRRAYKDQQ